MTEHNIYTTPINKEYNTKPKMKLTNCLTVGIYCVIWECLTPRANRIARLINASCILKYKVTKIRNIKFRINPGDSAIYTARNAERLYVTNNMKHNPAIEI